MSDISYNCCDKRKYYRLTNPVKVTLEGQEYTTLDWSVSACKISDYAGLLEKNEETIAEIEINFQGFSVKFYQKIRILRYEPKNGSLIAEYIDPSPRNREILSYFSRGLITGEFQAFEDIIKHVDVPVTDDYIAAQFEEDETPSAYKRGLIVLSYILLGIMVLVYAYNLIYTRGYVMQVDSAIVTSRTEVIQSPGQGVISEVHAKEGDKVKAGQELFTVMNPELQMEIKDKKIEILKNKALLREKQRQLDSSALLNKIEFLSDQLAKNRILYEKKLISRPELDNLQAQILELEQDFSNLEAEKERIEATIAINETDLAFSESINALNTVKVPFDGVLEESTAFKGKPVDEDTPLMVVKSNSDHKYIEAYLDASQPHELVLNSGVQVEIPLYGIKTEGVLTEIHRKDEQITAVVEPDNPDLLDAVKLGTPVKITLKKNKFLGLRGEQP